jgi:lipopolysaccharide transport system ATP-binding protein
MLGFSRQEMKEKTKDILDFAELEEYMGAPVKSLSSGMVARLGFAIATEVHPDILILDEVLSVGDESFKNKCKRRLKKFWNSNATILVVSHDLTLIQESCDQVIWLNKGQLQSQGTSEDVIKFYLDSVHQNEVNF